MNATTLTEAIIEYVEKSIAYGGRQERGHSIKSYVDYAVYYYLKTVRPGSAPLVVNSFHALISNLVLAHKNSLVSGIEKEERKSGTLVVTSVKTSTGILQEEGKKVEFHHIYPVHLGQLLKYDLVGGLYIIQEAFTGATSGKRNKGYGGDGNTVIRIADLSILYEYIENVEDPSAVLLTASGSKPVPAGEQLWYSYDGVTYGYFDGKTYRETSEAVAGVGDLSVDCSAYMFDAAGGSAVSNGGISYTRFPGATKAMKVVFYGKYRLALIARFYYTDNNSQAADAYEVGVFDLLIIDTETSVVTKLGPTHSTWYNITCPNGMYVGYVDIQVNKENGKLLVLKSADSPTTTNIGVLYYIENDPVTDPQIYDHTTNATVYRVPFTLDEMTVDPAGDSLVFVQNLYTHDGVVSSVDGVSVIGGITSTMFTQQPDSYNIYINRHMSVFKQQNTVPTTPEEVLVAYQLLCYGRWEFYGITEAAVLQTPPHSTACGAVTTTAVADKATAVVQNYLAATRPTFIREYIPSRNRLAVDNSMMFHEHLGANYTGKANPDATFVTYSGSTAMNITYNTANESSFLNDNRFVALTDNFVVKFLWATRVQILFNWFDPDENFSQGYTQGYTFWKQNAASYEMDVLDATPPGKSQRWNGGFVNGSDPTLIEYTFGYNNVSTMQLTDSEVLLTVSRGERVDYLNSSDWSTRNPSEVHYENYSFYMKAMNDGVAGALLADNTAATTLDLVKTENIELLSELSTLISSWV